MPYNIAQDGKTNVKRVGLGSGRLFIKDPYDGSTPSVDVGYGRGGQLQVTRQKIELILGVPRTMVAQFAIQEDVTLSFNGVQWDGDLLSYALGAGVVTGGTATLGGATIGTIKFGGDMAFKESSVMFTNYLPAGGSVSIDIWKCQGSGEVSLSFGDDIHELPYSFRALTSASEWGGGAVNAYGALFRIRINVPV